MFSMLKIFFLVILIFFQPQKCEKGIFFKLFDLKNHYIQASIKVNRKHFFL